MQDEYQQYNPTEFYYIISIDIGIKNLAIVLTSIKKDFTLNEIVWIDNIDITTFIHLDNNSSECQLFHERTHADYLEHVFVYHTELFDAANYVIIERQPLLDGLVSIEQLIFYKYRKKAILISPISMHCFFGWNKLSLDYEQRKVESEKIAREHLSRNKERSYLLEEFDSFERRHDIADAICIMLYWLYLEHKKWNIVQKQLKIDNDILLAKQTGTFHYTLYLDQFKRNT